MNEMQKAALEYVKAGLSVIPTGQNKKSTLSEWGPYQKAIADESKIRSWFKSNNQNIAIIGGRVSGHLEITDFDCEGEALPEWEGIIRKEAPGLLEKLYFEISPHGAHIVYRCDFEVPGSTELAKKLVEVPGPGEYPHPYKLDQRFKAFQYHGKWIIAPDLIEAKGEGGYCLVYPSKGYTRKNGNLCALPVLTKEERNLLMDTARSLNEVLPEVRPMVTL